MLRIDNKISDPAMDFFLNHFGEDKLRLLIKKKKKKRNIKKWTEFEMDKNQDFFKELIEGLDCKYSPPKVRTILKMNGYLKNRPRKKRKSKFK